MEIHIGSSSYLSKFLSNKTNLIYKISSKKQKNSTKVNYNNLSFFKKIFKDQNIDYIFFFLGKNFKGKASKKSAYVNYELPLKILNYLIKINKKKLKIIFFGTFLEYEKITSRINIDYKNNKINLRNKIQAMSKKNEFEFVWLKLPIIYGEDQVNKNFTSMLINNIKINKTIKIHNKFNTLYLLNIYDVFKLVLLIKRKWKLYKNRIIVPKAEGPFFIFELINKLIKKTKLNIKVVYENKKKRKKIKIKKNLINYNIKKSFTDFLLQNV